MTTTNFNLRGIPGEVMLMLKQEAKKQRISINSALLDLIQKSLGYCFQSKTHAYHELDKLAGTWSKADAKAFAEDTKFFEKIDKELWK